MGNSLEVVFIILYSEMVLIWRWLQSEDWQEALYIFTKTLIFCSSVKANFVSGTVQLTLLYIRIAI